MIPLLIAAGVGAAGLLKGNQGRRRFQEAKDVQENAQKGYVRSRKALEARREETGRRLERLGRLKIDIYDVELRDFVAAFRQIKNAELSDFVDPDEPVFEAVKDLDIANLDLHAIDAAKTLIAAGGAGAAAGAAAWSAAVTFGAASTGTAIATLGGAAATNATLAWFGGGAVAAGRRDGCGHGGAGRNRRCPGTGSRRTVHQCQGQCRTGAGRSRCGRRHARRRRS